MFTKKSSVVLAAGLAISATAQTANVNMTMPTSYPYNLTFVQGLAQQLTMMNLTSLASAVTMSINSTGTLNLLANINGTGKTLLAPTNEAFEGFMKLYPNSSNPDFVGDVLSYHLLSGSFPNTTIAPDPFHTVAETFLNDSYVVALEGHRSQALVLSAQGNMTRVLNQNSNVTLINTTTYENLLVHVVDAVIDIPGNISAALTEWNLTMANAALTQLDLVTPIFHTYGITLFMPNDAAFMAVNSSLMALMASNMSQVTQIFENHAVNGTTVYSTQFGTAKPTSSGGQTFTLASNSSGNFVTSGNYTAKVVTADILIDNGVMHIIDTVLLNNGTNPTAAMSAYSSATSAAAAATTSVTMGIGSAMTAAPSSSSSGSSGSKSSAVALGFTAKHAAQAVAVLAGVFAGAAVLI